MTELPPIPIPIPIEEIINAMGNTTVMAAIANTPIHCPTKIVSIIMFNDMTRIPIAAGTACFINNLLIAAVPNSSASFTIIFRLQR